MCSEKEINEISDITARHYNQNAVMFYKISNDVKIINYNKQTHKRKETI